MFELFAAFLKLTGKYSLLAIRDISVGFGADPATVLGGIVVGSCTVVTLYFFGPLVVDFTIHGIDYTTNLLNDISDNIDC